MKSRRRKERRDPAAAVKAKVSSPVGPTELGTGEATPFGRAAAWVCLILIALNIVVYAPVRHFDFVNWDDFQYVTGNSHVSNGLIWPDITWALTTGYYYWQPLTWLSHMLDAQLYGLNAGPHHVTSVLLHIGSTILLFALLYRITGALGRSAFVAGLFAIHPLRVESVAWVAERKDVLSTLFWMLTVWAYVWYVRQPSLRRYLVVLLVFLLALMSKPMVVTLPFVLLLLDFWPLGRAKFENGRPAGNWPALVKEKIPLFALSILMGIFTLTAQRQFGAVAGLDALPLSRRLANALVSYVAYVGKMVWPTHLAAFYPYPQSTAAWQVGASVVVLIAISVAALRLRRRHPYLLVGWLWYLGMLLPVSGLFQAGDQAMADRFTYVPLIGLFLIVAWGVPDLLAGWRYGRIALPAAAVIALCACAIIAGTQVQYWRNSLTLWTHAFAVTEDNHIARDHLGIALDFQGRKDEAIAQYRESARLNPNYRDAQGNLGGALLDQGKVVEAIAHLSQALRIDPNYADAHINLANALAGQGKLDDAIVQYSEALRIQPNDAFAHNGWGSALDAEGKLDEAIAHYSAALRIDPRRPEVHHNLGIALQKQRKFDEAAREFTEALRLDPNLQPARAALEGLKGENKAGGSGTQ